MTDKPTRQQIMDALENAKREDGYKVFSPALAADNLIRAGLAVEPRVKPGWYLVSWYLDSPSALRRAYWDGKTWFDETGCVPVNIVEPSAPPLPPQE